jgi:putative sulfotransferase
MTDGNVVGSEARFIVGTGRCGSTILSKMLDLHPSVAVLSEFLLSLAFYGKFGTRPVSGHELARLLDCGLESTGELKKIVAHLATPEITFDAEAAPVPVDASAYRDNVLPDLMLLPLGHLFEDPTKMFEEIVQYAQAQPTRLLSEQYAVLFDWIVRRAGKTVWIERSGGSIASLPELVELFPNGKFLHLHRDPLDAALSMQAHNHFRLRAFKHHGLSTAAGITWKDLDDSDLNNDMPMSPKLQAIFDHPVSLEYFLQDWSNSILRGMKAVRKLGPAQYAEVTFEQMMSMPAAVLQTIVEFFELPDEPGWIGRACALLREGQAAHAEPNAAQEALLERHCRAAMMLLDRVPAVEPYR